MLGRFPWGNMQLLSGDFRTLHCIKVGNLMLIILFSVFLQLK